MSAASRLSISDQLIAPAFFTRTPEPGLVIWSVQKPRPRDQRVSGELDPERSGKVPSDTEGVTILKPDDTRESGLYCRSDPARRGGVCLERCPAGARISPVDCGRRRSTHPGPDVRSDRGIQRCTGIEA